MRFKEAYIKQFNAMEKALQGKLIEREKGIAVRQSLTKALQQSTENERLHDMLTVLIPTAFTRYCLGKMLNNSARN